MKKQKWSSKWPIEPGWYWFYGWPYEGDKSLGYKPVLNSVQVIKVSNGVITIRSGNFWYKSDWCGEGMFIKAEIPPLPDY